MPDTNKDSNAGLNPKEVSKPEPNLGQTSGRARELQDKADQAKREADAAAGAERKSKTDKLNELRDQVAESNTQLRQQLSERDDSISSKERALMEKQSDLAQRLSDTIQERINLTNNPSKD